MGDAQNQDRARFFRRGRGRRIVDARDRKNGGITLGILVRRRAGARVHDRARGRVHHFARRAVQCARRLGAREETAAPRRGARTSDCPRGDWSALPLTCGARPRGGRNTDRGHRLYGDESARTRNRHRRHFWNRPRRRNLDWHGDHSGVLGCRRNSCGYLYRRVSGFDHGALVADRGWVRAEGRRRTSPHIRHDHGGRHEVPRAVGKCAARSLRSRTSLCSAWARSASRT